MTENRITKTKSLLNSKKIFQRNYGSKVKTYIAPRDLKILLQHIKQQQKLNFEVSRRGIGFDFRPMISWVNFLRIFRRFHFCYRVRPREVWHSGLGIFSYGPCIGSLWPYKQAHKKLEGYSVNCCCCCNLKIENFGFLKVSRIIQKFISRERPKMFGQTFFCFIKKYSSKK